VLPLLTGLYGLLQLADIEPIGSEPLGDGVVGTVGYLWGATEYPQILAIGVAYDSIRIIGGEVDNPVFAPEWEEKLHFQFGVAAILVYKCFAFYV
jgi:hypothetical protein